MNSGGTPSTALPVSEAWTSPSGSGLSNTGPRLPGAWAGQGQRRLGQGRPGAEGPAGWGSWQFTRHKALKGKSADNGEVEGPAGGPTPHRTPCAQVTVYVTANACLVSLCLNCGVHPSDSGLAGCQAARPSSPSTLLQQPTRPRAPRSLTAESSAGSTSGMGLLGAPASPGFWRPPPSASMGRPSPPGPRVASAESARLDVSTSANGGAERAYAGSPGRSCQADNRGTRLPASVR